MRTELLKAMEQSGLKIENKKGAFTNTLNEGDRLKAEVLSSDKGMVTLKTESGQILRARLDPQTALSPGDKVLLEVAVKEQGFVSLAIREDDSPGAEKTGESAGQQRTGGDIGDKDLEPYANKLSELKMPVSEETAREMREIISQNPGMSLDEAAFLASNKIAGDASLIKAALAVLAGGEKTDSMIERLFALLDPTQNMINPELAVAGREAAMSQLIESSDQLPADFFLSIEDARPTAQNTAQAAPLTDFLEFVGQRAADVSEIPLQGDPTTTPTEKTIIPQSDGILQSTIVEKIGEFLQTSVPEAEKGAVPQSNPTMAPGEAGTPVNPEFGTRNSEVPMQAGTNQSVETAIPVPGHVTPEPQVPAGAGSATGLPTPDMPAPEAGRVLAEILSEIPEFRGTPAPALERFSDMLYRVARDSADVLRDDSEKLEALIDKLFTRIAKNDSNAGERLRLARQELFARLALIEEAISRSAPPARAALVEQTGRLMDHVRLLNSIDQFVYMQLPVMIGEERKTAELYLFKRKGGKKPDPENVNILLALDLENMGHWESLINFRNKDVSVKMEVAGLEEKKYFGDNTVMLHEMLAEAGFKLVSVNITYSEEETTPLNALAIFDKHMNARTGTIDFKV